MHPAACAAAGFVAVFLMPSFSTFRFRQLAWAVLFVLACVGVWRLWHPAEPRVDTQVIAPEVPVVMRTEGGLLEVAVVRALERFTRADTRDFWGFPLGTTVSHIQAPAFYRYQIPLAKEWALVIRGQTAIIHAPALQPSLPVAFDTTAMQKFSQSGWARFDKEENLQALERSMTSELEKRARSAAYLQLAAGPARQTVGEFVTKWLIKEKGWGAGPDYRVVVLFPGETESRGTPPDRQD